MKKGVNVYFSKRGITSFKIIKLMVMMKLKRYSSTMRDRLRLCPHTYRRELCRLLCHFSTMNPRPRVPGVALLTRWNDKLSSVGKGSQQVVRGHLDDSNDPHGSYTHKHTQNKANYNIVTFPYNASRKCNWILNKPVLYDQTQELGL